MADFVWPADLVPYRVAFYLQPYNDRKQSPFTRAWKIYDLAAPLWVARLTFRGGYRGSRQQDAYGPRLDALLTELRGGANRVAVHDFRRPKLRGSNDGHSLTNEAADAGDMQMVVGGFAPHALAFLPGDYIGGDGRAHIVPESTGKLYADASGSVTVGFWPPLAIDVAEGDAIYGKPTSWFRLTDDNAGQNEAAVGGAVEYVIDLIEDFVP